MNGYLAVQSLNHYPVEVLIHGYLETNGQLWDLLRLI